MKFRACSWSTAKKAVFKPVETGITGVTDIEITKGLCSRATKSWSGSYKALRTLKPEASVKVDNSAPKKTRRPAELKAR